jgi:hypothetical protein
VTEALNGLSSLRIDESAVSSQGKDQFAGNHRRAARSGGSLLVNRRAGQLSSGKASIIFAANLRPFAPHFS